MAFRSKKKEQTIEPVAQEKILDVDASMQGSLTFRDPVNLRINGKFEGNLDTKGNLTVGENAHVQADIVGEDIVISGRVAGNVTATNSLTLSRSAHLVGDINTPRLGVVEGAFFKGKCQMQEKETSVSRATLNEMFMTVDELAKYLEVDSSSILNWAKAGRIPAQREGANWKFDRTQIDSWIASEKIK